VTAPCSAMWTDHVLPLTHHCGGDEGHPGPHSCAACTQNLAGAAGAQTRKEPLQGGADGNRPGPELVTAECGPFWAHEDCDDPGCTCRCHESGGSES